MVVVRPLLFLYNFTGVTNCCQFIISNQRTSRVPCQSRTGYLTIDGIGGAPKNEQYKARSVSWTLKFRVITLTDVRNLKLSVKNNKEYYRQYFDLLT